MKNNNYMTEITYLLSSLCGSSELTPEQEAAADILERLKDDLLRKAFQNDSWLFYFKTAGSRIDLRTVAGKEPLNEAAPYEAARAAEKAKFLSAYNGICRASKADPLNAAERPPVLGFFNYMDRLKSKFVYEGWIAISNDRQLEEIWEMQAGNLWPTLSVLNQTCAGEIGCYLCKMSRLHRLHPDPFPIRSLIIR